MAMFIDDAIANRARMVVRSAMYVTVLSGSKCTWRFIRSPRIEHRAFRCVCWGVVPCLNRYAIVVGNIFLRFAAVDLQSFACIV